MPTADYWKRRAHKAEADNAALKGHIDTASELLQAVLTRMEDRAALTSITREGRTLRMTFVRNGVLTTIEAYASWSLDIEQLRMTLLHRTGD